MPKISRSIGGLKCDNPNCDYVDKSIRSAEYENYIGYPCPKCGQPLLTQEDYDAMLKLNEQMEKVATLLGIQIVDAQETQDDIQIKNKPGARAGFKSDGKGNISLKKLDFFNL